jgi:RNA recognition motif-containing protein
MNIYVGNLSNDVTEEDLKKLFEASGQVESVNIIKDKFSGQSRGFAFVEIPNKNEALAALKEADGKELNGKAIKVNEARARTGGPGRRPGGGSRGSFGGGSRGGFGGGGRGGRGGGSRGGRRY